MTKKIRVCNSRSCTSFGSERVMQELKNKTGLRPGEKNDQYDLDYCGCLGWCSNSPNVEIDDHRILFDTDAKSIWNRVHSNEKSNDTGEGREIDVDALFDRLL